MWVMLEWLVGRFYPREPWQPLLGSLGCFASGGGLARCRACLPSKGGPSLVDILLPRPSLGSPELHVGSSILLVFQSLF